MESVCLGPKVIAKVTPNILEKKQVIELSQKHSDKNIQKKKNSRKKNFKK
jgi:hypothetical protein